MGFEVPTIGKISSGIKKASGLYKISWTDNGMNDTGGNVELFSSIDFGTPIIKISSGGSYAFNFKPAFEETATYVSPTPTSIQLQIGSGSSTGNVYNQTKDHTSALGCGNADLPQLKFASPILVKIGAAVSSQRSNFRIDRASGTGNTICNRENSMDIIFELLSGDIVAINEKSIDGNPVTVTKV